MFFFLFFFVFFAARLWKRILCIVSVLLKRIDTRAVQKIRFRSRETKNRKAKNYPYLTTCKIKSFKLPSIKYRWRCRKSLEIFVQKGLYFIFFRKICLFFSGLPPKKNCLILNALFNTVKINFCRKLLHGTPYSTADFSPREFQANRSVTVKVLSL